jgi:hypothetical protein
MFLAFVFLKFLFEVVLICFIFFIVIVDVSLFQLLHVILWILWKDILKSFMIVLLLEVMMKFFIVFFILLLFLIFKLMTDSLNRMMVLVFWLFRILAIVRFSYIILHLHLLFEILNLLFILPLVSLFLILFFKILIVLFALLALFLSFF